VRRLSVAFAAAAGAALVAVVAGVYLLQYRGKIGADEAARDFLAHTSARSAPCVRGWRKLSSWAFVCPVTRPDDPPQTIHMNVDATHVVEHDGP